MKVVDFVNLVSHVMSKEDPSPANSEISNAPVLESPSSEVELQVRKQLADVFDTGYREGALMVLRIVDSFKLEVEISDEVYDQINSDVKEEN